MHAAGSGESAIDEDLYQNIRQTVVRATHRLCPSWMSAERDDIVQVVMMRVQPLIAAGEEPRPPAASYVWKTAYSVVVDEIRRRSRRQEQSLEAVPEAHEMSDVRPDPERLAAGRQLGRAIRECLRGLQPPRRTAVVLHLQGHRLVEIARMLGFDHKKTDNLVYRGMGDLRRCLMVKGLGDAAR